MKPHPFTLAWPLVAALFCLMALTAGCGGAGGASPPPGGGGGGGGGGGTPPRWIVYSSIDPAGLSPVVVRINVNGTGRVVLPTSTVAEHAAISPDGTQIAYAELYAGFYRLRVMNLDGTENTVIREGAFDCLEPSFSPDGRSILFSSTEFGAPQVFVHSLDTGLTQQLTDTLDGASQARFSPDGATIVYAAGLDIGLMNADGTDQRLLVSDAAVDHSPTFSPNGLQVAFVRDVAVDVIFVGQLHTIPAAGGDVTRISNSRVDEQTPVFNHDGSRILFSGEAGTGSEIYSMPSAGGTATQITSDGAIAQGPSVPWQL